MPTLKRFSSAVSVLMFINAAVLGCADVSAQEDGAPVSFGTYRVIESEALGETRRLLISLPRGYEGSAISYPVVYHTYGDYMAYYADAWSALARWGDEARTPQMILVGVDNIDRYRDLRPLQQNGEPAGIEDFTRFLSEEVIPFIEREYRTAGYRILAGPQAGAVFCLYTLQNHPDLFDAFILNNPLVSEPNTNFLLDQAESFYSGTESLRKFFYIIYGGAGESPEAVAAVERFARMTEPAREHGFDLRLDDISGNDEFIPPLHIKEGLRVLFSDYYLPPDRLFSSLADIRTFYDGLSKSFGYDVAPGEWVMTRSADALIEQGEAVPATEILEYQTSLYPNMVNGWWRLAGLAAGRGDTEEAIRLYEKCVEINPSMSNFVERRINSLRQTE